MADGDVKGADPRGGTEDPIIANLMRLGFSGPEARTYAALVKAQPSTAYELAKTSGLPRANSYNAVSGLALKGAIQPISSDPVRYVVTSPKHFFPEIAESIADTSRELVTQIEMMTPEAGADFVQVWEGRRAIEQHITEVIQGAVEYIHIKTRDNLAAPFFDELAIAAKRGVAVTIVASGEDWGPLMSAKNVTLVPHEGTGSTPMGPHEVLMTLTVDRDAVFIGAFGEKPRGFGATNRTLTYVIRTMILHEIYLAEITRTIGIEALEAAGVDFVELRKKYRPPSHGLDVSTDP